MSKMKDLSERVENIEKQIKENKEEQLKKLNAELDYAKFLLYAVGSDNRIVGPYKGEK